MKYKITYLPAAQNDLLEITEYIAVKLNNPEAALKQAERIRDAVNNAAENPYMYPVHYPVKKLKHDYRKIPVNNYLIFYWVEESKKTITAARILYNRRNYMMTDGGASYLNEPPMRWKLK